MCTAEDMDLSCGNHPTFNATSFTENGHPTKSCKQIRENDYRRHKMCSTFEVNYFCPHTCGSCCKDYPNYTFKRIGMDKEVGCIWILKNSKTKDARVQRYCTKNNKNGSLYKWNNRRVRDACAESCDFCFTGAEEIVYEPSTEAPASRNFQTRSGSDISDATKNFLAYADVFYMQNAFIPDRYLTGSRSGSNTRVTTYPYDPHAKFIY